MTDETYQDGADSSISPKLSEGSSTVSAETSFSSDEEADLQCSALSILIRQAEQAKKENRNIVYSFKRDHERNINNLQALDINAEKVTQAFNLKNASHSGTNGLVILNSAVEVDHANGTVSYKNITSKGHRRIVKLFPINNPDDINETTRVQTKALKEYHNSKLTKHLHPKYPQLISFNGVTCFALVTRQMPGTDLLTCLNELKEKEKSDANKSFVLAQRLAIAAAVIKAFKEQVYDLGLMHLDIKPENIMVYRDANTGEWIANIIDYGEAVNFNTKQRETIACGTPAYLSFEQLTAIYEPDNIFGRYAREYDWENLVIDLPALATTLVSVLSGKDCTDTVLDYLGINLNAEIDWRKDVLYEVSKPIEYEAIAKLKVEHVKEAFTKRQLPKEYALYSELIQDILLKFQSIHSMDRGGIDDMEKLIFCLNTLEMHLNYTQAEDITIRNTKPKRSNCFTTVSPLQAAITRTKQSAIPEFIQTTISINNKDFSLDMTTEAKAKREDLVKLGRSTCNVMQKVEHAKKHPSPKSEQQAATATIALHDMLEKNTSISVKTKESAYLVPYIICATAYTLACASLAIVAVATTCCPLGWGALLIGACCVPGVIGSIAMGCSFFTSPAQDLTRALPKDTFETNHSIAMPAV
jgi:serine/threonine protein kinase